MKTTIHPRCPRCFQILDQMGVYVPHNLANVNIICCPRCECVIGACPAFIPPPDSITSEQTTGNPEAEELVMSAVRFNELVTGPIYHPKAEMLVTRMTLALWAVIQQTKAAGARAFENHCRERESLDKQAAAL